MLSIDQSTVYEDESSMGEKFSLDEDSTNLEKKNSFLVDQDRDLLK